MIGIFDSGIGGLSVFREIRKVLPEAGYIYYSDNAHCPYGEKTVEYVTDRARAITELLLSKGADIIVVACNTATAAAIATLRKEYSDKTDPQVRERVLRISGGRRDHIMFIGMEPAVKPAVNQTKTGVVGVLATAGTLKAEKYKHVREYAEGKTKVVEHIGEGFVELVEAGELSGEHAESVVKSSLQPLLDAGADVIVLGCTHYPFLAPLMKKIAGPGVSIIDPAPAVAKHLCEVLREDGLNCGSGNGESTGLNCGSGETGAKAEVCWDGAPRVELLASGSDMNLKSAFKSLMMRNRYALVTGASSGLGREIALNLASRGINTILISLAGEELGEVAQECMAHGTESVFYEFDLTDFDALRKAADDINSKYQVFILVNNAGFGGSRAMDEASFGYMKDMILLNAGSTALMTKSLLNNLLSCEKSYVLNISSMAALIPCGCKTVYPASKAFVRYFSVGLREEMRDKGMSVSVAILGPMETKPEIIDRIRKHKHSGKLLTVPLPKVADKCVRGMLAGKRTIVPGIINRLSRIGLKFVPERMAARIMTKSVKKEFTVKE